MTYVPQIVIPCPCNEIDMGLHVQLGVQHGSNVHCTWRWCDNRITYANCLTTLYLAAQLLLTHEKKHSLFISEFQMNLTELCSDFRDACLQPDHGIDIPFHSEWDKQLCIICIHVYFNIIFHSNDKTWTGVWQKFIWPNFGTLWHSSGGWHWDRQCAIDIHCLGASAKVWLQP